VLKVTVYVVGPAPAASERNINRDSSGSHVTPVMCKLVAPAVGNLANTFEARSTGVHSPCGKEILWVVGFADESTKVIQFDSFPLVIFRYVGDVEVVVTLGNLL